MEDEAQIGDLLQHNQCGFIVLVTEKYHRTRKDGTIGTFYVATELLAWRSFSTYEGQLKNNFKKLA